MESLTIVMLVLVLGGNREKKTLVNVNIQL